MSYTVKRLSELVIEVRAKYKAGDIFTFLLLSDLHFDHPYCDREALKKVMDRAKDQGAGIMLNGDTLCLMQAQSDKRANKSAIRDEHKGNNYFDLVIKDTAEHFAPYADNLVMMADGNHETAVLKHKEINPLNHLAHRLNADYGANVLRAGYHGFVKFVFEHEGGGGIRSALMYHHHGKYGGQVTLGVLGVARHGLIIPQPDIIWTGHTHTQWHVRLPRLMVKKNGKTHTHHVEHVKTGTWKDEFNRPGGFGVERLNKPSAKGGYWLNFSLLGAKTNLITDLVVAK